MSEPVYQLGWGIVGEIGERSSAYPVCEIESISTLPMALPFLNDDGEQAIAALKQEVAVFPNAAGIDIGGAYIASDTKRIARELGLQPIRTPVCSPQSNGMAESFVNTFRRDYISRMDLSDAMIVMRQLPAAFEHFNNVHPHSPCAICGGQRRRRWQRWAFHAM